MFRENIENLASAIAENGRINNKNPEFMFFKNTRPFNKDSL